MKCLEAHYVRIGTTSIKCALGTSWCWACQGQKKVSLPNLALTDIHAQVQVDGEEGHRLVPLMVMGITQRVAPL